MAHLENGKMGGGSLLEAMERACCAALHSGWAALHCSGTTAGKGDEQAHGELPRAHGITSSSRRSIFRGACSGNAGLSTYVMQERCELQWCLHCDAR